MKTSIFRFVSLFVLTAILLARSASAQGPAAPGSGAPQPPNISIQSVTPNPFSTHTTVSYTLQAAGHLIIKTFDLKGREVQTLLDAETPKGSSSILIDGKYFDASGIYFCRFVWENQAPVTCNLSFEK